MIDTIKKLNQLLEPREKRKLIPLLLLTTAGAFFEMLGVSMVVPLVTAIMNPEILTTNALIAPLCRIFGITEHREFIIFCIVAMILVFIIKDLFLVFEHYCRSRFVFHNRLRMQQKTLHAFLKKPYEYYLNARSGEILRIVRTDVQNVYGLLMTFLSLVSESVVSLALIAVILTIDPVMTLLIAGFLAVMVAVIVKVVKPKLKKEGKIFRENLSKAYDWTLQCIQGIKEIKVGGRERFFEQSFAEAGEKQIEAEKRYTVLNSVPKVIIEMGCVCAALLVMLIMILAGREPADLIPAFAAFAMAAVKLMPASNRIINAVNAVAYHGSSIDRLLENLQKEEAPEGEAENSKVKIKLQKEAELSEIGYRYPNSNEIIFDGASMKIPVGHSVGIVGTSGAGKTTAVDILLGLLKPERGCVLSDGVDVSQNLRGWQDLIGYIPQSIFMMDGTVRDNVVFGADASDDEKVWKALREAQLEDFIRRQPDGLDTQIGERGIRLSGGQRQRIGIARALYEDPELLVFDEATSSLDNETEAAIMESINSLHGKKTMVIIAHRLQTIENCDMVYRVPGDGSIIRER
ncbi:MAG: ABC transporter ATP-binding protein [Eubacteriales bacterium]|nr:ABC transporter ATP-binding protein [Eubacteriales bacterium]